MAQSFERRLEQFVEGFFARTFRSGLQPVELGRRLVREMDRGKTLTNRGVVVANHFIVALSPPDAERFSHFEESLQAELVAGLTEQCGREGWKTLGPVEVHFETDDALKIGRYVIESRIVEAQPPTERAAKAAATESAKASAKPARRKPAGAPAAPAPAAAAAAVPDINADIDADLPDLPEPDDELVDDVTAEPEPEVEVEVEAEAEPEVEVEPVAAAAAAPDDDYAFPMLVAHDGTEIEVYPGTMLLGRLEDCAVVFEDPNVSRHHAQIDSDEQGWVVRDLGSTNGTFVNGKRISAPTRLGDGDRIAIGRNTLVYRA